MRALRSALLALSIFLAMPVAHAFQAATYPLHVSDDRTHLIDAEGRPFLIHGDTAWALIAELTREEVDHYLADRRERGFNTLVASLIEYKFATNAPANAYGERPFLGAAFIEPNDRYFDHAEWVLARAQEEGFTVMLTPAYMGFGGGGEGWYADMQAAGPDALREYGRYLARRFNRLDNIVWLHGGDYTPADRALLEAVRHGLADGGDTHLATVHGGPDDMPAVLWQGADWLDLETVYTYGNVHGLVLERWNMDVGRPIVMLETAYEGEHGSTEQSLRQAAYGALLAGAAGQIYGNNPIWHFSGPGIYQVDATWMEELSSRGAVSMTHLKRLFDGVEWWALKPVDGDGPLRGDTERAFTAIARDGSWALSYVVNAGELTFDTNALAKASFLARWYDPSSGRFHDAVPVAASLMPPSTLNEAGYSDWVLLVTAE